MPSALHRPPLVASHTQDCRQHLPRGVVIQIRPHQRHVPEGHPWSAPSPWGEKARSCSQAGRPRPCSLSYSAAFSKQASPAADKKTPVLPSCSLSLASKSHSQRSSVQGGSPPTSAGAAVQGSDPLPVQPGDHGAPAAEQRPPTARPALTLHRSSAGSDLGGWLRRRLKRRSEEGSYQIRGGRRQARSRGKLLRLPEAGFISAGLGQRRAPTAASARAANIPLATAGLPRLCQPGLDRFPAGKDEFLPRQQIKGKAGRGKGNTPGGRWSHIILSSWSAQASGCVTLWSRSAATPYLD